MRIFVNIEMISERLENAVERCDCFFDEEHEAAFRLFNGFQESLPELVIDIYAKSAILHWYGKEEMEDEFRTFILTWISTKMAWIEAVILKMRFSESEEGRKGRFLVGDKKTTWVKEHGVRYSVDLCMNRDASFYLDTRLLRLWLKENSEYKRVLNTFAYTGSLGVAATAGLASRVVQCDLNKSFLNVAKTSHSLNGFPIKKADFQVGDFWKHMNVLKRKGEKFDILILDPPFFSETKGGRIDLSKSIKSMINKVRPLVVDGGKILLVNNALFVSGAELEAVLDDLYDDWLSFDRRIDVDLDFVGGKGEPIKDPAPYNHSTKITLLIVKHR